MKMIHMLVTLVNLLAFVQTCLDHHPVARVIHLLLVAHFQHSPLRCGLKIYLPL
ncbi:hypothetical protein X975_23397, partial [Stegodyphus mimosarum]